MTPTLEAITVWQAESADAGRCQFCGDKTKGTQYRMWVLIGREKLRQKFRICRSCKLEAIKYEKQLPACECPECLGSGEVTDEGSEWDKEDDPVMECPECHGTGKKPKP